MVNGPMKKFPMLVGIFKNLILQTQLGSLIPILATPHDIFAFSFALNEMHGLWIYLLNFASTEDVWLRCLRSACLAPYF